MLKNLKITAKMASPVCFSEFLRFDCILSAAVAKELLSENYYVNSKQYENEETVIKTLSQFLKFNEKYGVFHASCATAENEFVTCYSKRWNGHCDECVSFKGKGRPEIDTLRGFFKAYRNPIVYHTLPEITFYAVGDEGKISLLLNSYIHYLGKKSSQGYGQVRSWSIEEIAEDKSIFDGSKLMRFIPASSTKEKVSDNLVEAAVIPPAYRKETVLCYAP